MTQIGGDDIVISGVDGRFPKSPNMEEYGKNLYNKVDMGTYEELRWTKADYPSLPLRKPLIDGLEKFDATLFKIHSKQADIMDPQGRILLEQVYSALLDAGVHPATLRGSNTGVFAATCYDDTMCHSVFNRPSQNDGYAITGNQSVFLSNRLSNAFDLRGPSFTLDSACSSTMYALLQAVNAMRLNQCDAALVCGANILLNANLLTHMDSLGVLSSDGFCHSFDSRAHGYVRADAVSVIFLQKRKDARRVYADIVHILGNNDGYKTTGPYDPSAEIQSMLFNQIYSDLHMDPSHVDYVEAHATGTVVGDLAECTAIDNVFNKNRKEPLLVGAVKPNMGHSEASSALCSIAKVIHTLETGLIPPTIDVKQVRQDIAGLREGRLKVCTETTPLPGPLVAVNSFGFGGANAHVLLRQWNKTKKRQITDKVPRLVFWSGRTEEAITTVIDRLKITPVDPEFIGLLHGIQKTQTPENLHRGFCVLENTGNDTKPLCLTEENVPIEGRQKPIVWVFSGLGSQWTTMGKSLMQIKPFYEAIMKCHDILKKVNYDLITVITSDDKTIFDSILNSITAIGAIQAALVDVLKKLKIPVDYIIGHSAGEMMCAYADGAVTMEQAVLCAYYKAKVSYDEPTIVGAMGAIGLSYNQIKDRLPAKVYAVCHNSANSCTISGHKDDVIQFIEQLNSEGIFARVVPSSDIAFHSKYIENLRSKFHEFLKKVIPERTVRSSKWLSSSILPEEWGTEYARYNTAEYHANNMVGSVYFEEACSALPQNSIMIEVAPHGLFKAILRNTFPQATYIPLTQKGNANNAAFFMTALGKLFVNGVNINIECLYPAVEFPVSRGTPMISPLIKYDHEQNWFVPDPNARKSTSIERNVTIDISTEKDQHMANHVVNDRILMPGTSYIYLVWETLALMSSESDVSSFNVELTNIRYRRATTLLPDVPVHLSIVIHTNGNFELTEGRTVIVSGHVKRIPNNAPTTKIPVKPIDENSLILSKRDVYNELTLRGYKYAKSFKAINSFCPDNNLARVQWNGHWDVFMDVMAHVILTAKNTRMLHLPTSCSRIRINAIEHMKHIEDLKDIKKKFLDVVYCEESNTVLGGGIEITGLNFKAFERRKPNEPELLESCELIPLIDDISKFSLHDAIRICVQLVVDKLLPAKIEILEILDEKNEPVIEHFRDVVLVVPRVNATYKLVTTRNVQIDSIQVENLDENDSSKYTIVISNGETNDVALLLDKLSPQGFLIIVKNIDENASSVVPDGCSLVSMVQSENLSFSLLQQKSSDNPRYKVISVNVEDQECNWVRNVQQANETDNVVLVADRDKVSGVIGFLHQLRGELYDSKYQCIIIDDDDAPTFDIEDPFYRNQLILNLPYNVYRNGKWGTYRFLTLKQGERSLNFPTPLRVEASLLGNLESLEWIPMSETQTSRIQISYAGLSAQDIKLATADHLLDDFVSKTSKKYGWFGREFSGIDSNGNHVMGVTVDGGALATEVPCSSRDFIFKVPNSMSLQEAATIPIAYLSVYSAFFMGNQISAGQTILIDGTDYIGLAAIRVALAYGLQVFVVVSSEDDKYLLLSYFPELNDSNISTSFDQMIMNKPYDFGLDLVLSSSAEDHMEGFVKYLSEGGTLFSIEPFALEKNSYLNQQMFERGISCKSIFLETIAKKLKVRSHLIDLINQDLKFEVIKPLPATIFKANKMKNAFRFMSTEKSIEKIIIQMPNLTEFSSLNVKTKFVADSKAVYIITGGLGALGLELAYWLIRRGVKNLVISSRRNTLSAYEQYRFRRFRSLDCNVIICASDITTLDGCKNLLQVSLKYGPVYGIFSLAAVLLDSMFSNQTPETFQKSFAAKAQSALYLDELSRTLCPQLQHFVGFSSLAASRGTGGQSSYANSNASLDRIIENRARIGLPGISIQWGPISDVGMAARLAKGDENFEICYCKLQRIDRCLHVLDDLLFAKNGIVGSAIISRKKIVEDVSVFSRVLSVFGVKDLKKIPASATLSDLGVDSMIISEVKQILEREANISLTANDLRNITIDELKKVTGTSIN